MDDRKRPSQPQARGESDGSGDEKRGKHRIAQGEIGARQVGLDASQAKHGYHGQGVEDPLRENKKGSEIFECAAESHDAGKGALKDERVAGRAKFRMHFGRDAEEKTVAGHGVIHAGATQDGRIHCAQRRNDHG